MHLQTGNAASKHTEKQTVIQHRVLNVKIHEFALCSDKKQIHKNRLEVKTAMSQLLSVCHQILFLFVTKIRFSPVLMSADSRKLK